MVLCGMRVCLRCPICFIECRRYLRSGENKFDVAVLGFSLIIVLLYAWEWDNNVMLITTPYSSSPKSPSSYTHPSRSSDMSSYHSLDYSTQMTMLILRVVRDIVRVIRLVYFMKATYQL